MYKTSTYRIDATRNMCNLLKDHTADVEERLVKCKYFLCLVMCSNLTFKIGIVFYAPKPNAMHSSWFASLCEWVLYVFYEQGSSKIN